VVMTARSMPIADPPLRLVLDRPFMYMIRDQKTESILFLGQLLDPAP
jgi:serine protease inhibitor